MFLMTFIVWVKSYMEVSSETSDVHEEYKIVFSTSLIRNSTAD